MKPHFCNYHGVYHVRRDITNTPLGKMATQLTGQTKTYESFCPKCRAEGMDWKRAQQLVKEGKWDRWAPRWGEWQ